MKTLSSWLLLLVALIAVLWVYSWHKLGEAVVNQNGSKDNGSYDVVYEQDFSGDDVLEDFQFTDPSAWRMGKTNDGRGHLELFGKSKYKPKAYSPLNIALLTDKKVRNFILDLELQQTGKEYGHRDMCVFYNFEDPSHFYYTHIASQTDDRAHNIFIVDGEPRKKVSHKTTEGHQWTDGWHNVRIVRDADSGKIAVYVDDMNEPIMEAVNKKMQWGYVGVGSFDDTGRIRHLKLRAPESKEGDKITRHFEIPAGDK